MVFVKQREKNMKRLPLMFSFLSIVVLGLSLAFWGMRILTAPLGNTALAAPQENIEPVSGQWGNLFGAMPSLQDSASNYQLKGVLVAQSARDSAAIISINGKSAQSLHVNQELMDGVVLSEVHEIYIIIKEAGIEKRISLPLSAFAQSLTQTGMNEGVAAPQKTFNIAARNRSAPIPIPEPSIAEISQRPNRLEQPHNDSELPTASYRPSRKQ